MERSIKFRADVRKELETAFDAAWDKAYREGQKQLPSDHPLVHNERDVFISLLEGTAETAPEFVRLEERKQQDRKRAIRKVGNALGKLLDAIEEVDHDSKAFLLYSIIQEAQGKEAADQVSPYRYFLEAATAMPELVDVLSAAHAGALRAEKELPIQRTNAALSVALGIERYFWQYGFEFNASQFSFAAKCLSAVFEAAGMDRSSLQYWIEQTRAHPDSLTQMANKHRPLDS